MMRLVLGLLWLFHWLPLSVQAAVGRALARTGARTVVLPPDFPEDLVPEGPWTRLKDTPPLTVPQLDAADAWGAIAGPEGLETIVVMVESCCRTC